MTIRNIITDSSTYDGAVVSLEQMILEVSTGSKVISISHNIIPNNGIKNPFGSKEWIASAIIILEP